MIKKMIDKLDINKFGTGCIILIVLIAILVISGIIKSVGLATSITAIITMIVAIVCIIKDGLEKTKREEGHERAYIILKNRTLEDIITNTNLELEQVRAADTILYSTVEDLRQAVLRIEEKEKKGE